MFMEPTRITVSSATCIDNIFTNVTPISKTIISTLSSDHCGQLLQFENLTKCVSKCMKTVVPVTTDRIEKMRTGLAKDLPFLSTSLNPNDMYNLFFYKVENLFNTIFTKKHVSAADAMVFNEWATQEIHKKREKLYELYAERQYNTSDEFKQYVKLFSKEFKKDCIVAKSKYIHAKIKNSSNVIKTTWKIINEETGRSVQKINEYKLSIDNKTISSDSDVANAFEAFFTDIPVSSTKDLNSSPAIALSLLENSVPECNKTFSFSHVSSSDVIKTFKLINNKKTNDLWGISVSIVRSLIDIVAPELALIFNNCIDCGVFPDLMKFSKVIPLFKSGSTSDPTNFRPISVLPTFSKIFEKLILEQLLTYFHKNNLLHTSQFGFTRGRSTTDAGVELIQNIFDAWEESHDALGVFCDLSKAFDCVEHETLVRKLCHYGVKGAALQLMRSYLNDRVQKVDVNGKLSPGSLVKMGVPQGSILGPFLFLIYINDLPYLVEDDHEIVLFADDTSLVFKVDRHKSNYDEVNRCLAKVVHWFEVNNLLLNGKKTKCLKFTLPNVKHMNTTVLLNNEELDLVDTAVFLGITLDAKLQWGPHLDNLSSRLSSAAYAVKKIRQLTDIETARLVYFSYFHSIMSYCILLWGNAAEINSIFVLQKRAVRAIYNMGPRESLKNKFKEIKIMTVYNQYIFENLVFVHKNIDKFDKKSDVHNLNTRYKNKLVLPTTRLSKIRNSFVGNSVQFYNKLPGNILDLSIKKFKILIKRKLLEKSYYSIKDYISDKKAWE